MKVLITGFESFDNDIINPSAEVVNSLPDKLNEIFIIKKIIPTVFNKSLDVLKKEIDLHNPDIVICVGQAGGRQKISIERVAINIDDARIPDNDGNKPIDKTIQLNGDAAYFSTLPIKSIYYELIKNNIPAEISNTAGTFVCNHIMYQALHLSNKNKYSFKSGFIHIPYIKEQIKNENTPYMESEDILNAIKIIITSSVKYHNKSDLLLDAGKEY